KIDLSCDGSHTQLFKGYITLVRGRETMMHFDLPRRVNDLEVRIYHPPSLLGGVQFRGAQARRAGAAVGLHQRESMVLLVNLVALRLQMPYLDQVEHDQA